MKGALLMMAAAALLAPIHAQQQYYMAAPMYYPAQMQPGYNPYMAYNPYMGYPMMPVPNQMTPAPNQSQQQPQQQSNVWDDPLFWSIKEGNKDIDDHLDFEKNMLDDNFLQMSKPAAEPPGVTGGPIWQMPEVAAMTSNLGTGDRLRPVAVLPKHTSSAMHDDGHDTHEATKGASESHGHHHFGYKEGEGPETWPKNYPGCAGKAQSPVDIRMYDLEPRRLPPLVREHLWAQPDSMVVENNGHTLELDGEWHDGKWPTMRGGPLLDLYQFKQAHFHWGRHDAEGSEHTVNGNRFPMEMHMVHWNTKYGKYEEAVKHDDGLAVLAGFFEITKTNNSMIEVLLPYLNSVTGQEARGVHMLDPTPIGILPVDLKNYVTYQGSLTTPPCSEVVTWIVPITPLTLSDSQMARMRSVVKEDGADIINFRPAQPLNGRKVYVNSN